MVSKNKFLRNVHGIVLLNKPKGITSNAALQDVKRLFRAKKAGHTGSLDPIADGLLPLCFGEATKISAFLLEATKKYRTRIKLGQRTTTGDTEGEILEEVECFFTTDSIEEVLCRFRGKISQVPPMFSALKHHGVPLYKLARQGIEVQRKQRDVTIYTLDLIHFDEKDNILELDIHCSKGTYIRSLAEDIGSELKCGAHVCALSRTGVGAFSTNNMVSYPELVERAERGFDFLDESMIPMETALSDWPEVNLTDDAVYYMRRGQPVFIPKIGTQGYVKLVSSNHRFIGVGRVLEDGRVAPKKLVNMSS